MKVTREVINDLLPLYLADEASTDSRSLVEEFLRGDPEFAGRLERARHTMTSMRAAPELAGDLELKTLRRTRRAITWRSTMLGAAIFMSLVPLSVSHDAQGTHWMMVDAPLRALAAVAIAAMFWGVYWRIRRTVKSAGV